MYSHKPVDLEEIELEIPKHVLASGLSVKPEVFCGIIKSLKVNGVLEIMGSKVMLNDLEALEHIADVCALPIEET